MEMTGRLEASHWLDTMEREYLLGFIAPGGSSVKVVLTNGPAARAEVVEGLTARAERNGFLCAQVEATAVRIHLIDRVFHAVAAQLDWRGLTVTFVRRLLEAHGIATPSGSTDLELSVLAERNDRDPRQLGQEVRRLLERQLLRDPRMCQEFRCAMVELCLQALGQGNTPEGVVEEWLRGELRLISAMKGCLVFQKITRHNARHMVVSLAHWLRLAGRPGLVLLLDISRYLVDRRPQEDDGTLHYSRLALLDAYEVIRRLIDGTDDMEGVFAVVLATPELLTHEKRGLHTYPALEERLVEEIRFEGHPNPLAALVRVASAGEPSEQPAAGGRP